MDFGKSFFSEDFDSQINNFGPLVYKLGNNNCYTFNLQELNNFFFQLSFYTPKSVIEWEAPTNTHEIVGKHKLLFV